MHEYKYCLQVSMETLFYTYVYIKHGGSYPYLFSVMSFNMNMKVIAYKAWHMI